MTSTEPMASAVNPSTRQDRDQDLTRLDPENIVLFGPPGAGKSTVGSLLAERLDRPFVDVDVILEREFGRSIETVFEELGEARFRRREAETCRTLSAQSNMVIAAGGGALQDTGSREALEASGQVIVLTADLDTLLARLDSGPSRPLLGEDPRASLSQLLSQREALYHSFQTSIDTSDTKPAQVVTKIIGVLRQKQDGIPFLLDHSSPNGKIVLGRDLLPRVGEMLSEASLQSPLALVTDSNLAPLYGRELQRQLNCSLIVLPAGEENKDLATLELIYNHLSEIVMERGGTLLALGGGVVGDLTGFAAATFMRGISWVNLPTTLLAMVDAAIGGKVAANLPTGKNMVGAFHQPDLVIADTTTLTSLPSTEFRNGLAETIKAGVIGDPRLFQWFELNNHRPTIRWLARAIAVKVEIVNQDPYERGVREHLNYGHTIGHGLEAASHYQLAHGQAIALGMLMEAELAEAISLTQGGLAARLQVVLEKWGLPVTVKLDPKDVRQAMNSDKKRRHNRLRFALPAAIGDVQMLDGVPEDAIMQVLKGRLRT